MGALTARGALTEPAGLVWLGGVFTTQVWTVAGLTTYYVMSFMRVASRQVWIAGITTSPDRYWMAQMARNASLADVGFLNGCRYLVHDRDAKFCAAFDAILKAIDIQAIKLPPHSPNLNAHLERWHRSVKEEIAMRRRNQPIHSNLPAWHRSQDAVNLARISHPNV